VKWLTRTTTRGDKDSDLWLIFEMLQARPGAILLARTKPPCCNSRLTHPSVAHEQGVPVQHNQRLEFLGDAVLQTHADEGSFTRNFPGFRPRGPLTKARAKTGEPPGAGGKKDAS